MQKILVATDLPDVFRMGGYRNWIAAMCMHRGAFPNWNTAGKARPAWVCRGKWVVSCDAEWREGKCMEQILAQPGEPFFCPNCLNGLNGGLARPVEFPRNIREIESILLRRAIPDTRNWYPDYAARNPSGGWLPGETIRDLVREQVEHGEMR